MYYAGTSTRYYGALGYLGYGAFYPGGATSAGGKGLVIVAA